MEIFEKRIHTALKNLPKAYQSAVTQLIKDVEPASSFTEMNEIYHTFLNRYTAIAELFPWYYDQSLASFQSNWDFSSQGVFAEVLHCYGFSHLINDGWGHFDYSLWRYLSKSIERYVQPTRRPFKRLKTKIALSKIYTEITYLPLNRFLPPSWTRSIYATSPIPKKLLKICEQSHNESKKILSVNEEDEKWFELVTQTKDIPCIVQNVECRIGRKPWNKKLWSLYWEFLREQNLMNLLLHSYSRYCRLFFEDIDMFEVYKVEVDLCSEASMNVVRWKLDIMKFETDHGITEANISPKKTHDDFALIWLNIDQYSMGIGLFRFYFDTEVDIIESGYFENPQESYSSLSDDILLPYVRKDYKEDVVLGSPPLVFSPNPSIEQAFSLPKSYLRHVLDMESDYVTQKLYFTCKWFFMVKKTHVCYKLDIGNNWDREDYYENSLFLPPADFINSKNLPNFYFTKTLSLQDIPPNFLLDVIAKTSRIAITELQLYKQTLTLQEFRLLSKEVMTLIFAAESVVLNEGMEMTIPEIIDEVPKIKHAVFNTVFLNPFIDGPEVQSKGSLETFFGCFMFRPDVPVTAICNFIEKNAAPSFHFSIDIQRWGPPLFSALDEEKAQILLAGITDFFNSLRFADGKILLTLNRKDYTLS